MSITADVKVVSTIKEAVDAAVSAWKHCLHGRRDAFDQFLLREFDRLKIWAATIGVYAKSPGSADERLADDEELHSRAIEIVLRLAEVLVRHVRLVKGEQPTESEASSSESSEADDLLDIDAKPFGKKERVTASRVRTNIGRLYSVLTLIRRTGSLIAYDKLDEDHFKGKLSEQLYSELITQLEDHVRWKVERDFGTQTGGFLRPSLRDRLVKAAVSRRKALLYKNRHDHKLQHGIELAFELPTIQISGERQATEHASLKQRKPQSSITPSTGLSATAPSAVSVTEADGYSRSGVQPLTPSKSVLFKQRNLDLPPPPKMPKAAFEFKCYTCQLPLGREFQEGAQWRNHVLHDIDPYVCLFEDCATSNVLYKSSDDWWQHMQTRHRMSWFCPDAAHRQQTFGSRAALEAHICSQHAKSVPSHQMAFILDDSVYPLHPIFEVCPICGTTADLLRSSKTSASQLLTLSTQIQDPLRRHIESHLDEIALLSLLPLPEASGKTGYREVGADSVDADNTDRDIKDLPLPIYDAEYLASASLDSERADPDAPPLKLTDADRLNWKTKCAEVQAHLDEQRNAQWYIDEVVQKRQIEVILSRRQDCPRAASCFIHHIRDDATSAKIMQLTRDLDGVVDVIIESSSAGTGRACELVFGTTDAAVDALTTIIKWVDLAGSARLESRITELHNCFLETIQHLATAHPPVFDSPECIAFLYHDIQCLRLARWGKSAGIVNLDEQRGRIVACYLTEQQEIDEAKRSLEQVLSVHVADTGESGVVSSERAFGIWQKYDLGRRIGKLSANVDRAMKRTLGLNQISSSQASLRPAKLVNFNSVLRLTRSIDRMLDNFEKTLALQAALAVEEVKQMVEELDDDDMAALQELSVADPVLAGAVDSAIVPNPASSALSSVHPSTPWEHIMQRADSVAAEPRIGHNYGTTTIAGNAVVHQGNLYDQPANFLRRGHQYRKVTPGDAPIIDRANVFQGDISTSGMKDFWRSSRHHI